MKRIIFLFIFLKLLAHENTYAQVTFNKTYDAGGYETIFNILPLNNGYWTVMNVNQTPDKYRISHLDSLGDTLLTRIYESPGNNTIIQSMVQTADSNFVTGCFFHDLTANVRSLFLVKFNNVGDTLWSRHYHAPAGFEYYGRYIITTSDNGFLLTGVYVDLALVNAEFCILKTDSLGNLQWVKTFGGISTEDALSSIETPDKGFLTSGWTRSFGFGNAANRDILLVKWDSLGNYQWHKTIGDVDQQSGWGLTKTSDGNYLISTGWYDIISPVSYGEIIKIDVDGNIIWDKLFGGGDANGFWWSKEQSNFDIVSVSAYTNTNGYDDGWVLRTDSSGNEKWQRRYRVGTSHCYFRDVQETSDGGIICAGFVFVGASGGQDGWLVKLDSTGCLAAGNCGEPTGLFEASAFTQYQMTISPNPISSQAIVKLEGLSQQLLNESYQITVIDISGRKVQSPETGFLIGDNWIQFIFRPENLTHGVYFLEVSTFDGERMGVAKVIIE